MSPLAWGSSYSFCPVVGSSELRSHSLYPSTQPACQSPIEVITFTGRVSLVPQCIGIIVPPIRESILSAARYWDKLSDEDLSS